MRVVVSNEGFNNQTTSEPRQATRLIQVMPNARDAHQRKEGELLKYKNVLFGWGKRYFRLERTYLHYFESKFTHKPVGTITRGEITSVKVSEAFPNLQNVFEIVQRSGQVWYCQAASVAEMVGWMQALSQVPILLDPNKYPITPMDQVSSQSSQPPAEVPTAPTEQTFAPSPYRHLMEEAHHTAYWNQTPHECQHQHQHHRDSPPPPYSADGHQPPPALPSKSFSS